MSENEKATSISGKFTPPADGQKGERKVFAGSTARRKVCRFCVDKEMIMDYKNFRVMQAFVTEHGRIVPRRISGLCANHQRKLTIAVKQARQIAVVGYVSTGY